MGAGTAAVRSSPPVRRRKWRSVSGPIPDRIESGCWGEAGKTLPPAGRSWTGPYGKSQYQVLRRGAQCAPVIRASVRNGCWKSHIACGMGRRFQWLGESRENAASCGPVLDRPLRESQYQVLRRGAQCAPVIRASVRNGCWKSHIACGMGRRFQWFGESRGKAASCGPVGPTEKTRRLSQRRTVCARLSRRCSAGLEFYLPACRAGACPRRSSQYGLCFGAPFAGAAVSRPPSYGCVLRYPFLPSAPDPAPGGSRGQS